NEAGKGIVSIDVRDGFTLVNSSNYYDRLTSDVVQITFGSPNYLGGQFPLSHVMVLPFLFDTSEEASAVYWRLYKSGLLNAEFATLHPLALQGFPQSSLHLVKAPTTKLLDLKGLRIIGGGQRDVIGALGGTAMAIALTDSYEALQRGTADGMLFPMAATHDFKIDEVTHYHILASLGGGPGGIWMTKAKYQSLSPAVQKVLDANTGEAPSRRLGYHLDQLQEEVPKLIAKSPNQTIVPISAEQLSAWKKEAQPVYESWNSADKAKGDAALAKVRELDAEVRAGH
ncbi:MAG TPA: TRAP transporter substrate-binding protein DctP, partial [Stellaceae bacterium]|nr:TRAP transporter substrate-binding protein DctP [Stellaceae bacterium]